MLFDKKKQYQPYTESELKQRKVLTEQAKEISSKLKETFVACAASPLFKDYKETFLATERDMIDLMLRINLPTMEEEWKFFKQLQSELMILRDLKQRIEMHSKD
jgi:hypothetical protein